MVKEMTEMFNKISYHDLNAKQKEQFNFQKISAVLADYGFLTIKIGDDWKGADFLAHHVGGDMILKVQLKGRLWFEKKYIGKNIWMCFRKDNFVYLYPHDDLLNIMLSSTNIKNTKSWIQDGIYHFPSLRPEFRRILEPFKLE